MCGKTLHIQQPPGHLIKLVGEGMAEHRQVWIVAFERAGGKQVGRRSVLVEHQLRPLPSLKRCRSAVFEHNVGPENHSGASNSDDVIDITSAKF